MYASNRCVAVETHDQDIASLPSFVEDVQVPVVEHVEAAVDGDDPFSLGAQRSSQMAQRVAGHQPERIGVLKNLFRSHRRGPELADHDAGGAIRDFDRRRMIGPGGARERERRDNRVAGTADVEHFPCERWERKLLPSVPAAERDPVRTEGQHDIGSEFRGKGTGHCFDRFFGGLGIGPSQERP